MAQEQVVFKLSEIMGRHRLTITAVAEASGLRVGTVSAIYHDRTSSISKDTLGKVLDAIRLLSKQNYSVADLVAYQPNHTKHQPSKQEVI